ncbi:MAG TPA: spore coat protein, partial [Treponemataceae bacterium]|nr:spore coat protein [Treponemataceae bacterium]
MICVVIQARLDSTRLPQKALLSLADKPLIVQVMNNAKRIPADSYILACDHDSEQIVTPLAVSCGYRCIAGPK